MSTPSRVQGQQPSEQLMQLASGYMVSSALYTATKLGIPGLLKDGPKSTKGLAQSTGSHEDSLYRLLRALASAGVLNESAPRTFELHPVGGTQPAARYESCQG